MRKITFILMALFIGFASCSDDDDDIETCSEYNARYTKKFEALDPTDFGQAIELITEYAQNLPEGCQELDLD